MKSESRRPSLSSTVLCSSSANSFSEPGSRNLPGPRKLKMLLLLLWRERKGEPGMLSSDYRGQGRERERERETGVVRDQPTSSLMHPCHTPEIPEGRPRSVTIHHVLLIISRCPYTWRRLSTRFMDPARKSVFGFFVCAYYRLSQKVLLNIAQVRLHNPLARVVRGARTTGPLSTGALILLQNATG